MTFVARKKTFENGHEEKNERVDNKRDVRATFVSISSRTRRIRIVYIVHYLTYMTQAHFTLHILRTDTDTTFTSKFHTTGSIEYGAWTIYVRVPYIILCGLDLWPVQYCMWL